MNNSTSESINAGAWIVNWICVVIVFLGLVMLSHDMRTMSALRNEQIQQLIDMNEAQESAIKRLVRDMDVRPKDVLPHVLAIERILTNGCAVTTARK
jgi:hypothetical protein